MEWVYLEFCDFIFKKVKCAEDRFLVCFIYTQQLKVEFTSVNIKMTQVSYYIGAIDMIERTFLSQSSPLRYAYICIRPLRVGNTLKTQIIRIVFFNANFESRYRFCVELFYNAFDLLTRIGAVPC